MARLAVILTGCLFTRASTSANQSTPRRPGCCIRVAAAACAVLLILPLSPSHARSRSRAGPFQRCRAAIKAAERTAGIPDNLLSAIGLVESGRTDPITGVRQSWPWTVNVAGQGYFFNTAAEAVDAVQSWQARGVQSLDVGCMQVNLMYHSKAFASLEEAFDPIANADFASRFLRELFWRTNDWRKAAAAYHSATTGIAVPYERKVLVVWHELSGGGRGDSITPGKEPTEAESQSSAEKLAQAWSATLPNHGGWDSASLNALMRSSNSFSLTSNTTSR